MIQYRTVKYLNSKNFLVQYRIMRLWWITMPLQFDDIYDAENFITNLSTPAKSLY